jgi:hypothetical protein
MRAADLVWIAGAVDRAVAGVQMRTSVSRAVGLFAPLPRRGPLVQVGEDYVMLLAGDKGSLARGWITHVCDGSEDARCAGFAASRRTRGGGPPNVSRHGRQALDDGPQDGPQENSR